MTAVKRLCAALAALFVIATSAGASEFIKDFRSDVQINKDSSLTVTETLLVHVENIEIKRGIVRYFPVQYKDKDGRDIKVGFSVISVLRDGRSEPWTVEDNGDAYAQLRIGNKDVIVPPGLHSYVIRYKTTRQIGFFEKFDELYWNATGNSWPWPIQKASCTVSLPREDSNLPFRSVEWYVGKYGSKNQQTGAKTLPDSSVVTTDTLNPGEGLTVVYTFQKGLLTPPQPFFGSTKAQGIIAMLTLAALLCWLAFAAYVFVSRPTMPAIIARFYPPGDASPAYVRYVLEKQCDQLSFAANIMQMAIKGALRVVAQETTSMFGRKSEDYSLKKMDDSVSLTEDERTMFIALFEGGDDMIAVEQVNGKILNAARSGMNGTVEMLCSEMSATFYGVALTGALIIAAGIAAMLPFTGDSYDTPIISAMAAALIFLVGFFRGAPKIPVKSRMIVKSVFNIIVALVIAVLAYILAEASSMGGVPALLYCLAAAAIAGTMPFLSAFTKQGADIYAEAAGLKLYIAIAEKDRMELLDAPEETPELFERLLPYAAATGEVKAWSDRFKNVLEKAQYKPEWFVGSSPYIFFNSGGFSNFTKDLNTSAIAGMPKPEVSQTFSSGSGGGGSGW